MKLQVTGLVCVMSGLLVLVVAEAFGGHRRSSGDFAVRQGQQGLTSNFTMHSAQ
ncbi:hypothetical protein [Streptomyces acidicola]|uniref:hypothetical protein n=1 Tax=Streptomyces acidicola TaxID=2596892 RepID=UPI00341648EA